MAKSKVSQGCLDAAAEALGAFTDSELEEYVKEVFNRTRDLKSQKLNGVAALEQAQKEIGNETLKRLYEGSKNIVDRAAKVEDLAIDMRAGKINLREILIKRAKGFGRTLSGYKKAATERLRQIAYGRLEQDQFNFLREKKNGMDIAKALDGKAASDIAKTIAESVNSYLEARTTDTINSGALPMELINDDRFFRHIHDRSKLLSGDRSLADSAKNAFKYDSEANKSNWRNFIKQHLDLFETFKHTDAVDLDGNIINSEVDKVLNDIFDNITQNKNDIFSRSKIVNGKEEIMKRRRMFFKFKDWEHFGLYNEKYGTGDFFSAMESDIHGSGSKIGTAELFGSNPDQTYFDLKKVQQEASPATSNIFSKGPLWYRNTDLYYQVARGIDQAPVSPTLANFFGNIRSATSMARLPLVTINSQADIAYIASYAARWGMNYWDTYGYHLKNVLNVMNSEDRAHAAKLFKGLCDSELGFIGRFSDSNNSSELMKKASMGFYRANGLHGFDKGNKVGIITLQGLHLGEMSKVEWSGLNNDLKRQLLKHDFTETEWNVLRKNTEKGFFSTDNVVNMTNSQIKDIWEQSNKIIPQSQIRNRLFNKVFSIFDVASENAVLTPGEFEKAWLYQGTAPGTILGEMMRSIGFFKSYPLAYVDRVLVNGFKDKVGASAKFGWALQMSLGTLPLSLMSSYFNYLAKGLSFPDVTQMSPTELAKFGGEQIFSNLGIYLNIFDARNQNKSLVVSQLKTAPLELIGDMISAPLALAGGNWKQAKGAFKDAAEHVLPLRTLPVLGPYMDDMLEHKPYLQPQQNIIYGYGK